MRDYRAGTVNFSLISIHKPRVLHRSRVRRRLQRPISVHVEYSLTLQADIFLAGPGTYILEQRIASTAQTMKLLLSSDVNSARHRFLAVLKFRGYNRVPDAGSTLGLLVFALAGLGLLKRNLN